MVRWILEDLKTSFDSLAGFNLLISDRVLEVTIANVFTRNQRTVKLMHVIWFELKHKIPLMCLVGLLLGGKKVVISVLKMWLSQLYFCYLGNDISRGVKPWYFCFLYKFWRKIKSLLTVGNLLYKDVTPRDIFLGDFFFSVFTLIGCFSSKYVEYNKNSCKEGKVIKRKKVRMKKTMQVCGLQG